MKPILFNTKMVRAIVDGCKTATRRVVREPALGRFVLGDNGELVGSLCQNDQECIVYPSVDDCPYQPSDILYVRETWCHNSGGYRYRADDNGKWINCDDVWHPSIHMPKEAARLFLRVKDVRVERVQDITEEQAKAEGCYSYKDFLNGVDSGNFNLTARDAFADVWDSTIKPADLGTYGWESNPWVWIIEFERITKEVAEHG